MPIDVWLVMKTARGSERPFRLNKDRTVIGREATSDLRIAVPRVANRHCELILDADTLTLQDLGSASGTLHNGKRVEQAILADADELTVGPVTLEVRVGRKTATGC